MIMFKKMIILLLALMYFIVGSGFFMVVCHGYDGHIAIEQVVHNHGWHSEDGGISEQSLVGKAVIGYSDHTHCKDSLITSTAVISIQKNVRYSIYKVITASFVLKMFSSQSSYLFSELVRQNCELSSYHRPLRTVIILA